VLSKKQRGYMEIKTLADRFSSFFVALFFLLLLCFGYCLVLYGFIIFIDQSFDWLKNGYWTGQSLSHLLLKFGIFGDYVSQIEWEGFSKVLNWILNLSSVLFLVSTGSVCVVSTSIYSKK